MKKNPGTLGSTAITATALLVIALATTSYAQGSGYNFNDEARNLVTQADRLLSSNQPQQAIPLLERASALAPYSFEIYQALGVAYQNSDQAEKAIVAYQKALTISPQAIELLINIAHCYKNMDRVESALTFYDKYLQYNPADAQQITAERQSVYARILFNQGKYSDAKDVLEQVLITNPNDSYDHQNLGAACMKCRDFEKAILEFQTAYKLNPQLKESLLNIGTCYQVTGKAKDAIAMFKEYLRVDPNCSSARTVNDLIVRLSELKASNTSATDPDYFEDIEPNGNPMRWGVQTFPIRVYIAPGFGIPGYQNSFRDDFINALNDWTTATGERLGYIIVPSTGQANVVCQWTNDPSQVSEDGSTASGGETKVEAMENLATHNINMDHASIRLLTASIDGNTNIEENVLKYVCLHEIGHMLGLQGHSGNNQDIMFFSESPSVMPVLSSRDKATILRLYQSYPVRSLNYEQFSSAF